MARADDDLRDERQRAVDIVENVLEFRDEKSEQHGQHAQCASTNKMHGYNIAVMTFDFSSFSRD